MSSGVQRKRQVQFISEGMLVVAYGRPRRLRVSPRAAVVERELCFVLDESAVKLDDVCVALHRFQMRMKYKSGNAPLY